MAWRYYPSSSYPLPEHQECLFVSSGDSAVSQRKPDESHALLTSISVEGSKTRPTLLGAFVGVLPPTVEVALSTSEAMVGRVGDRVELAGAPATKVSLDVRLEATGVASLAREDSPWESRPYAGL